MPKVVAPADSYDRLLTQLNKRRRPLADRTQCECGKEVFASQLDKHRLTTIHHVLLFKKNKIASPPQN